MATSALDLLKLWPDSTYDDTVVGTSGHLKAKSAAILLDVGAGNLAVGSVSFTPTLQESDSTTDGSFTPVGQEHQEWFQDGVPGRLVNGVWVGAPNGQHTPPLLDRASLASHTYMVSYVGGLKRYVRILPVLVGEPSTIVSIVGLVDAIQETYGKIYSNYDAQTGGIL